jgi:hypothetical protein
MTEFLSGNLRKMEYRKSSPFATNVTHFVEEPVAEVPSIDADNAVHSGSRENGAVFRHTATGYSIHLLDILVRADNREA